MRSHAPPMARASMMSRMSHRTTAIGGGATSGGGANGNTTSRTGVINYDNASQVNHRNIFSIKINYYF